MLIKFLMAFFQLTYANLSVAAQQLKGHFLLMWIFHYNPTVSCDGSLLVAVFNLIVS